MLNVTSNTANAFIDSGEFCIPVGTRFSAGKSSVLFLCYSFVIPLLPADAGKGLASSSAVRADSG